MADDVESVEYSFEGDVSSLKDATTQAISLLQKYSASIAKASQSGDFKVSKKAMAGMSNSIKQTTKLMENMQKKLGAVGDVKVPTGSEAYKALDGVLRTVSKNMKQLDGTSKMTTKTFNSLKANLNNARTTLAGTSSSIDKLVQSEQRFQNINKAVGNTAAKVRSTLSGAFEPARQTLAQLVSRFDPIVGKLQSFKSSAQTAFDRAKTLAQTCASAFRRVSQTSEEAADSAEEVAEAQEGAGDSMQNVAQVAGTASTKFQNLGKLATSLSGAFTKSNTSSKTLSNTLRSLTSVSRQFASAIRAVVDIDLGSFLADGVKSAIDLTESVNLFKVAMGESVNEGQAFVAQMQEIYGLDPKTLYDTAGLFYQLTDAMGASSNASKTMSLSLTKATTDLSSLFNRDFETVAEDLTAGIQGQTKAVRKYGLDIRATTLEQTALRYGVQGSIDSMSEANRQTLRTITMLEQMSNATQQVVKDVNGAEVVVGDFANTIESPANQLRILGEQMAQLGRAVGNYFVTPLSKAMAYINGFVMALRTAISFVGTFLGVVEETAGQSEALAGTEDAVNGIGEAASGAAKKMRDLTAPFDELNVLQEQSSDSGSGGVSISGEDVDPALEQALADMSLSLENITMKANKVRDSILSFMGFKVDAGKILSWDSATLEQNLIAKFPQWSATIQSAFDNWSSIVGGFKSVFHSLGGVVDIIGEKIRTFFGLFINDASVSTWIGNLSTSLEDLSSWIDEHQETLANLAIGIAAPSTTLAPLLNLVGSLSTATLTTAATVVAVAAAFALLWTQSEQFRASITNLGTDLLDSAQAPLQNLWELIQLVWSDLQEMWTGFLQPMIQDVGAMLVPVIDTISFLLGIAMDLTDSIIDGVQRMWTQYVKPIIQEVSKAISRVSDIVKDLWEDIVGPIVERIGKVVKDLWINYIQPIVEDVIAIISDVWLILLGLWNNVLYPIVKFLEGILAPIINWVADFIIGIVQWLAKTISVIIKGITGILRGITDFLAGIFTGDWKKALSGLINILVSAANFIIGIFESMVNFVILIINTMWGAIYAGVAAAVNAIGGLIEGIAKVFGFDIEVGMSAKAPLIPDVHIPRIPEVAFARGGVVTGPTRALIGEGAYDEAVIPLGNSPQMADLVNKIADAVDRKDPDSGGPTEVRVFIGDKEWDAFTYKSAKRGEKLVGAQPIKEGQ